MKISLIAMRRLPSMRYVLLLMFFTLWFATANGHAQASAMISGTVTDSSGAVIPGVKVTIRNVATNVKHSTTTNSSGAYALLNIIPGTYSVDVAKTGFSVFQENGIVLVVAQASTFNFTLKVGSAQQSVTVNAEASEIQTSTAELGTAIPSTPVAALPLNGRNFTELLELTPGASRISVSQNSGKGPTENPVGQFTIPAINGQRNRSDNFLLDGINDLGSYVSDYNYEPIIDDIEEFKVESHDDLAEYGQTTGGTISVVTKGGTNQFHGDAWEFLRNSAFDSRNYFIPTVNPLRQNQFGLTFGGPIIIPHLYNGHNKTFFFFAYEGFRQSQASQSIDVTPTAAQLKGDFSNLYAQGILIYNPFSTAPDPNHPGEYTRQPFPGDQIPSSLLSPAALLFAKYVFPPPNASTPSGNLINTTPQRLSYDSYTGRIDQAIGAKDSLYGRISVYNQPSSASVGSPYVLNSATISGLNAVIHEVHTFSPTLILEGQFGRNVGQNVIQLSYPQAPANFPTALINAGFSNLFVGDYSGTPQSSIVPALAISGYISSGGNYYQNPVFSDTWEFGGALTKILGHHTIKAGADFATNNFSMTVASLSEDFGNFQTENLEQPTSPDGKSTGDSLASFLLGVPTDTQRRDTVENEYGGWVDGVYGQDQFNVTPKLTVNLGARWDASIWPINSHLSNGQGYLGDMDLSNGTYVISATPPACSATVGAPCIPGGALPAHVVVTPNGNHAIHNTDWRNWQARFGFAYHPFGKTTVMGGYGRIYDNWDAVTQYIQNLGGTWPSIGLLNENSLNLTTPTALMTNPLNFGSGTAIAPAATPLVQATFYFDPNMQTPYSDQWNFGIEEGFGSNISLTAMYVGSLTLRLDLGGLHNTATYPAPGTAAQVASRRLYPYIIPTNYDNSTGNSNYNALQTELRNKTSGGLMYILSYTWSKSIDLACSDSFAGQCFLQNPYDPQADRAVSEFDLTNMFSGAVDYQLPFGAGRRFVFHNRVENNVLGGWDLNVITSMTSGTPYNVSVNGDIANTGGTFVQADLVGDPNPAHRSASEWINPAAFHAPPRYSYGTFPRDALRTNWWRNADVSVFKTFNMPERATLTFRAEAFNVTNSVVFGMPGGIVGNPKFGVVTGTANTARQLQFALKLQF